MSQRARPPGWAAGAVALVAAMVVASAGLAHAQSGSSTLSGFSQGFNGGLSTIQGAVNVSTRDANGNLTIVDGVTQIGSDQSMFAKAGSTTGASDNFSGAGAVGGATAIGNNLSVNVSGNYNTVIVNSTQTNTGAVSATTTLNGKVNLDAAAQ